MTIKGLIKELKALRLEDSEEETCPNCGDKLKPDGSCPECDPKENPEELDDLGLGGVEE